MKTQSLCLEGQNKHALAGVMPKQTIGLNDSTQVMHYCWNVVLPLPLPPSPRWAGQGKYQQLFHCEDSVRVSMLTMTIGKIHANLL